MTAEPQPDPPALTEVTAARTLTVPLTLMASRHTFRHAQPHPPVDDPRSSAEPSEVGSVHRALQILVLSISAAFIVGFLYVVYGYVFSNGLCCGDDSYIAGAAKNLAFGHGYASSVPIAGVQGPRLFDPLVSTGPMLVLPAAALIRVFGSTPWAPGLATALLSTILLAILAVVANRRVGAVKAVAYIALMLALQYALTAGPRFVQWYALLGEVPAALLTVLGTAVIAWGPRGRRTVALAFLALGLAIMAKTLAVLGAIPVAIWLIFRVLRGRGRNRRDWTDLAVGASTFLAPFLAFEVWKAASLGRTAYLANLKDFGSFFSSTSGDTGATDPVSLWHRALVNSSVLHSNFGFGILMLTIVVGGLGVLVQLSADQRTKTFYWLVAASGMTHIAYFILGSSGNPRYALIGLLVLAGGAASVLFVNPPARAVVATTAIVALSFIPAQVRLEGPIAYAAETAFRPNQRVQNLQATADFLARLHHTEPLVGSWWATVDDLNYMLPAESNFVIVEEVDPGTPRAGRVLARNETFVNLAPSPLFREWESACNKVLFDAPPYRVSECPADAQP
jgi:hypothetical protein